MSVREPQAPTPGTRSVERDLAADGLEDAARIMRARGQRAEADQLEATARRTRWALPAHPEGTES
jgi:hypothetical protein